MEGMSNVLAFPEQPSARLPSAMTKPEARQVYQRLQEAFDQGAAQQSSLNAKLRPARGQASIKERELREAELRACRQVGEELGIYSWEKKAKPSRGIRIEGVARLRGIQQDEEKQRQQPSLYQRIQQRQQQLSTAASSPPTAPRAMHSSIAPSAPRAMLPSITITHATLTARMATLATPGPLHSTCQMKRKASSAINQEETSAASEESSDLLLRFDFEKGTRESLKKRRMVEVPIKQEHQSM